MRYRLPQCANLIDPTQMKYNYVCGFVPCYLLPKKMLWSQDPFLHPLVTEIEDAFIDGMHSYTYYVAS